MNYLKKRGEGLAAKAVIPITSGYRPEIDITPELESEDAAYYHSLIGVTDFSESPSPLFLR